MHDTGSMGKTLRLEIRGRVQGVGYRWAMVQEARRLGVRGWVRNRRDGTVEALVTGLAQAVDQTIAWARKGPTTAVVAAVDVFAAEGTFDSFDEWPTVAAAADGRPRTPRRSGWLPDIDPRRCTGCGRCVAACDLHLLSLERVGWEKFATLSEPERCTGCSLCAVKCPFHAITMRKPATSAASEGGAQPTAQPE